MKYIYFSAIYGCVKTKNTKYKFICLYVMARLKFTVVSEPMDDDDEECVDVGHAFLDLQELLLTGNDVSDQQIDGGCLCHTFDTIGRTTNTSQRDFSTVSCLGFPSVVSVDEDKEVIGNLKVSLEAAKALSGIYQEFHQRSEMKKDDTDEESAAEKKTKEQEEETTKDNIQIYCDDDSDF